MTSTSIVRKEEPEQLELISLAQEIRELVGGIRINIIVIGQKLIQAKEAAPHGQWLPWLKREFDWSDRTANNYMRIAQAFGKSATGADLEISIEAKALYLLSAPTVPEVVRTEAIEKAKTGETITLKEAQRMVAERDKKFATELAEEVKKATRDLRSRLDSAMDEVQRAQEEKVNPNAESVIKLLRSRVKRPTQQQIAACYLITDEKPPADIARTLAELLKRGVEDKNGTLRKGITREEAKKERERVDLQTSLPTALRAVLAISASPAKYLESLPDEGENRWYDRVIDELWTKAWPWLEEFNRIWRKHNEAK